jgi:hypothetical protein
MSLVLLAASVAFPCEWDYPIWSIHSTDADPLYRFIQNGKAGYIDQTGKIVIEPKFKFSGNNGGEFHDGLMISFWTEGNYDTQGRLVPGLKSGQFSEGLAVATQDDGKTWGYVDDTGRFIISPRFKSSLSNTVFDFSDGLAAIEVDGQYGYIDHTGNFVIAPQFVAGSYFNDGIARVVVEGSCRYAFIGAEEDPCFELTSGDSACKFAFINKKGDLISSERFDRVKKFSEGLAPVSIGGKWGFIDKAGHHVIEPAFMKAWPFSEGLARLQQGELIGYIDRSGHFAITPKYKGAEDFSDGRAAIGSFDEQKREWTYHYVDQKGKTAFPGRYVQAGSFYKGLAHVMLEKATEPKLVEQVWSGTYGYIDVNGKVIFKYEVK